jgi:hypothetical protein
MLSHCANSQCARPFLRLGEGRLFLVEAEGVESGRVPLSPYARRPPRRVERYWLCGQCAELWTLVLRGTDGIALLSRTSSIAAIEPGPGHSKTA